MANKPLQSKSNKLVKEKTKTNEYGGSIGDFLDKVRSAFNRVYDEYWVQDVFTDHLIVSKYDYDNGDRSMYRVNMTMGVDGQSFTFQESNQWQKVKLDYVREMVNTNYVAEMAQESKLPEVKIRDGVNLEELTKGDDDPFFLTLEIGRVGAISQNKLVYNDKLVTTIVEQINTNPIEGIMGHLTSQDRVSAYKPSDIHWLGAVEMGGYAYAKGYIPKTNPKEREHFRILQATGGKAATSIYGWADAHTANNTGDGTWLANEFTLEQLDLAPYTRAALAPIGNHIITSEMESEEQMGTIVNGVEIEETDKETDDMSGVNVTEFEQIKTRLAENERLLAEYRGREFNGTIGKMVSETFNLKPTSETGIAAVQALQLFVAESAAGNCNSVEDVTAYIERVSAILKPVTEMLVVQLSGPAAIIGETKKGRQELIDTPEARAQAIAKFGIGSI